MFTWRDGNIYLTEIIKNVLSWKRFDEEPKDIGLSLYHSWLFFHQFVTICPSLFFNIETSDSSIVNSELSISQT